MVDRGGIGATALSFLLIRRPTLLRSLPTFTLGIQPHYPQSCIKLQVCNLFNLGNQPILSNLSYPIQRGALSSLIRCWCE
jgi:hypothetical protein